MKIAIIIFTVVMIISSIIYKTLFDLAKHNPKAFMDNYNRNILIVGMSKIMCVLSFIIDVILILVYIL